MIRYELYIASMNTIAPQDIMHLYAKVIQYISSFEIINKYVGLAKIYSL